MSSDETANELDPRQVVAPGVLELDLDAIDPIAGVLCGARVWALHEGDALELKLPPECADAVIMDPPAGISFMGAKWDSDKGGEEKWIDWLADIMKVAFDALKPGGHALVWSLPRTSYMTALALRKAGFDIRDTIDHVAGGGFPKSLDVSKAIDAAAGAKREVVGSDRGRKIGGEGGVNTNHGRGGIKYGVDAETAPATPEAARWAGWGTALRPNKEVWWLCRKPLAKGHTVAANVLRHGVGGLNIDAARVGSGKSVPASPGGKQTGVYGERHGDTGDSPGYDANVGRWPSNITFQHSSWDEAECRACGVVAPFAVRFCPACGSGDVEAKRGGCRCVGERRARGFASCERGETISYGNDFHPRSAGERIVGHADEDGLETVDAWECLATCERCGVSALVPSGGDAGRCACGFGRRWACAVALLDEQSGCRTSGAMAAGTLRPPGNMVYGAVKGQATTADIEASSGGASRFFHCFPPDPVEPFWYCAKPSTAERDAGLDALPKDDARGAMNTKNGAGDRFDGAATPKRANTHPTVKGFHLIGHFCDLIVPPGGLVIDLTAGSGTLGAVVAHRHAATRWRCIMAELDAGHCKIIRERCRYWGARPWRPRTKIAAKPKATAPAEQPSLFGGGLP